MITAKHKFSTHNTHGVALVLVLSILVLLSGLMLAFFSSIRSESEASANRNMQAETDRLADTVSQIVISQIRRGTSSYEPNASATPTISRTWASQPGAIRTFDTTGGLQDIFKLYSSDNMIVQNANDLIGDYPAAGFGYDTHEDYSALWVDMNSPVTNTQGDAVYPILDPSAAGVVEGFEIDSPVRDAVMPVKWLYIQESGKILSDPSGSLNEVALAGDDTIIGRIAFWTDDESSKVNINTATGDEWGLETTNDLLAVGPHNPSRTYAFGAYWDYPRVNSPYDQRLGLYQPLKGEFQRYPGHPATVYLSAIIKDENEAELTREEISTLSPRTTDTGSTEGGTTKEIPFISNTNVIQTVTPNNNRIYSSIDELLFAGDGTYNRDKTSFLTADNIAKRRFFLTAHSNAPEVNLFGRPRIAIWPIPESTTNRTIYDDTLAFCATVGDKNYFFQRQNSTSPTIDINLPRNEQLYKYLQNTTKLQVPGFGGNSTGFKGKYGDDRDQILTEIFDYIRSTNLYDNIIVDDGKNPFTLGYNSSGSTPLPSHGQVVPTQKGNTQGFGRFVTVSEAGFVFIANAEYGNPTDTSLKEQIRVTSSNPPGVMPSGVTTGINELLNTYNGGNALLSTQKMIQAMFVVELQNVALGATDHGTEYTIEVEFGSGFTVNGISLGMPNGDLLIPATKVSRGSRMGGTISAATNHLAASSEGTPYPWIGVPIIIPTAGDQMTFSGGEVTIKIYSGDKQHLIQTCTLDFDSFTSPQPKLCVKEFGYNSGGTRIETPPHYWWSLNTDETGVNGQAGEGRLAFTGKVTPGNSKNPVIGAISLFYRLQDPGIPEYPELGVDIVRTLQIKHGDARLIASKSIILSSDFIEHRLYDDPNVYTAHSLGTNQYADKSPGMDPNGERLLSGVENYHVNVVPDIISYSEIPTGQKPDRYGDWDNGFGNMPDGPWINKPDGGNIHREAASGTSPPNDGIPYLSQIYALEQPGTTFFTPNRIIPSAAMFGSLPTGVIAGDPWQTLLFRPDTSDNNHPGANSPPDYLILDNFWMPVVEPYAISQPFSTAGKINMNYAIAPFDYITRSSGIRAVLASERIIAIPKADVATYKDYTGGGTVASLSTNIRLEIDADETLKQFEQRFEDDDLFRSETEICAIHLVPDGITITGNPVSDQTTMRNFWETHALTGDNSRERPYVGLLPKLTTKSNVFTIHYRVQVLKQRPGTEPGDWSEATGIVLAEQRGSYTVERYIDPNNPSLINVDFAAVPTNSEETLDDYYQFRVIDHKKFAP